MGSCRKVWKIAEKDLNVVSIEYDGDMENGSKYGIWQDRRRAKHSWGHEVVGVAAKYTKTIKI